MRPVMVYNSPLCRQCDGECRGHEVRGVEQGPKDAEGQTQDMEVQDGDAE